MTQAVAEVELRKETLEAFAAYVADAESQRERTRAAGEPFLWSDVTPKRAERIRNGEVLAELWKGSEPVKVPHGLIHDWVGAAFIPGITVKKTLALIQDYDNHKNVYKPEVSDSKLLSRNGNDFKIYLRLVKNKILTVVMDTEHDVHYSSLDKIHWQCRSYSSRVAEVRDAGTPNETVLGPDTGYGFLWRIYTCWTFGESNGGTVIECRAISLTRDIPLLLKPIIRPIVRSLPKESLINTLEATRRALK